MHILSEELYSIRFFHVGVAYTLKTEIDIRITCCSKQSLLMYVVYRKKNAFEMPIKTVTTSHIYSPNVIVVLTMLISCFSRIQCTAAY